MRTAHRSDLARSSAEAAVHDAAFQRHVKDGDRCRDCGDWSGGESAYAAALAVYPYQSGYWVQHGHMMKEQHRYAEAEISYRSAAALGVPADDVLVHARFVMARQGASEGRFPIRFHRDGPAAQQVPTRPDLLRLVKLLWRVDDLGSEDTLRLLRENATCDALFAALVADHRFERANMNWLSVMRRTDV